MNDAALPSVGESHKSVTCNACGQEIEGVQWWTKDLVLGPPCPCGQMTAIVIDGAPRPMNPVEMVDE